MLREDIKNRLVKLRSEKGMTQQEMISKMNDIINNSDEFGLQDVEQSRISYLEQGKIKKGYTTFISKSYLAVYASFFNIKESDILYGDIEDRKRFVERMYYKIAYNLKISPKICWNNYISYDQKLIETQDILMNLLSANAKFSYNYNEKKIESVAEYKEFNMIITDFTSQEQKIYDDTIEMFREIICDLLLKSFDQKFVNTDDVKFSNFNNNIIKWFNKEVKASLIKLEKEMYNDEILKIGFQVKHLLESIYENNSNELLYELLNDDSQKLFGNLNLLNNDERRNEFIKDMNHEYLKLAYNLSELQANYLRDVSLKEYFNNR